MIDDPLIATARLGKTAVVVVVPMSTMRTLHDQEVRIAEVMTPDRRREFTAGRIAAREALRLVGGPDVAIGIGAAGEPLWPAGFVGSVSHTRTHAAAFVATSSDYLSVGVDLDDERALDDAAASDLMTPEEVQRVVSAGFAADVPTAQRFVFSAKEAVFKCQYPLAGDANLDFLDIELIESARSGGPSRLVASWRAAKERSIKRRIEVFPLRIQGPAIVVAVATALC